MANKKKPTFEDVWALIHENSKHIKELRAESKELRAASKASDARVDKLVSAVNANRAKHQRPQR